MFGILLINKPQGITSHDVVAQIRRKFQTKRVGHAGTLDPLATGLLVLAVGPATRFLQYLPLEPKEYLAKIKFGESTNTYDADGEVTQVREVPTDLSAKLLEILPDCVGEIQQLPPMFSAVKKDGKPLYAYARKGEEVERQLRTIYIEELELISVNNSIAEIRLVCSGGTYVRTLAHDLGEKVGCGAHVIGLVRTKVGKFDLEHSVELNNVSQKDTIPLNIALPPLPLIEINETQISHIRQGRQIILKHTNISEIIALIDENRNVLGIGRVMGSKVQPECVIPPEAFFEVAPIES